MLFGSPGPDFANPPVVYEYPVPPEALSAGFLPLLPMVFMTQVFGSSMGEELGWRGFALPRLQARQSALVASGVLGVVWGIWHLPRVWTPGAALDTAGFGWLVVRIVLDAVLYTWIFNNTKGSLLLVLLLHTTQPVTNLFLAKVSNPLVESALTALVVILVVTRSGGAHLSGETVSKGRN
jgi:membrane protease YdiL (CAAX protease family)